MTESNEQLAALLLALAEHVARLTVVVQQLERDLDDLRKGRAA